MKKTIGQLVDFLGLKRNVSAVLVMAVLLGMGEKMSERFLPIYILAVGGSTIAVGLLNGMDNFLGAVYAFQGGYLSDKLGYKRALLIFNLVSLIGYFIALIFTTWQAVIIGAILFISWSSVSFPATMDLIASSLDPKKRTMGVSMLSLVRRIPMALGPLIGGVLITLFGNVEGVRYAFIAAIVFGVAALILQQVWINEIYIEKKAESNPFNILKFFTSDLRNLLVSDILIRFCEQIPFPFAVIWAVNMNGISPLQFGILTTIEMITAMLVYIPIAYLADKNTKKPFVLMTYFFFTIFPLVLLLSRSFSLMVIAFIIRGLKEFGEPTRKALIMDLAPEDRKASIFGLYYLIRDFIVSLAAFGGAFLWNISPKVNFLTAFGFGIIGSVFFLFFGRDLSQNRFTRSTS